MKYFHHYKISLFATFLGLFLSFWVGWHPTNSIILGIQAFFICLALALLEISLSFDNAVVNARVLETMSPIWQKRFLTWGIFIAVFLMRILFPIIIISFATALNPLKALEIIIFNEDLYAKIMLDTHVSISAFGGTFLMLVSMSYFFNNDKTNHWIGPLEKKMSKIAKIPGFFIFGTIVLASIFLYFFPEKYRSDFLVSFFIALVSFLAIHALSIFLEKKGKSIQNIQKGGVIAFLYLEILDASFSLDGVIGAFAFSKNIFIIAIGLGIGALWVRSLTIIIVKEKILLVYRYLENGAFYAIFSLSIMMYLHIMFEVPEYITSGISLLFLFASFYHSYRENKKLKI